VAIGDSWGYTDIYHIAESIKRGHAVRVRANGKCKTWKTRPAEFRLPFKYGLYGHGYIDETNAGEFTVARPIYRTEVGPRGGVKEILVGFEE
jgi:hypothetical protein